MHFSLDLLQWPAMVASALAAWLVASTKDRKRTWGFGVFLLSNILWAVWGFNEKAWAVVVLQACLLILNVRGAKKSKDEDASPEPA
jgi:hypothetical protein